MHGSIDSKLCTIVVLLFCLDWQNLKKFGPLEPEIWTVEYFEFFISKQTFQKWTARTLICALVVLLFCLDWLSLKTFGPVEPEI